nr:MAG TPA: hypothetical protein [Caudoviricetes sp.]
MSNIYYFFHIATSSSYHLTTKLYLKSSKSATKI